MFIATLRILCYLWYFIQVLLHGSSARDPATCLINLNIQIYATAFCKVGAANPYYYIVSDRILHTIKFRTRSSSEHDLIPNTIKFGTRSNSEHGQIRNTIKFGTRSNLEHDQIRNTIKFGTRSNLERYQIWNTIKFGTAGVPNLMTRDTLFILRTFHTHKRMAHWARSGITLKVAQWSKMIRHVIVRVLTFRLWFLFQSLICYTNFFSFHYWL